MSDNEASKKRVIKQSTFERNAVNENELEAYFVFESHNNENLNKFLSSHNASTVTINECAAADEQLRERSSTTN